MRRIVRRVTVAAGPAVVLLGLAAGVAQASSTVAIGWSPTTSPGTFSFGTLNAGQSSPSQKFTLTNTSSAGATSALTITLTPATGTPSSAFAKSRDTCTGTSLGPKVSCSVTVTYKAPATSQTDTATLKAAGVLPGVTASLTLTGTSSATVTPTLTTTPSAGGVIGQTALTDTASLSGGNNPSGSITFTVYGSGDTTCSNSLYTSNPVTVTGNGTYTSGSFIPSAAGTYQWVASYSSGDTNNKSVATTCRDTSEQVTVGKASPILGIALSPDQMSGAVGSELTVNADLEGSFTPNSSATITYTAWMTSDCSGTAVFTSQPQSATSNGNTYTSPPFIPSGVGSYYWKASYSGDTNNNPVTSACAGTANVGPANFTLATGEPPQNLPMPQPGAGGTSVYSNYNFSNTTTTAATTFTVTNNSAATGSSDALEVQLGQGASDSGFTVPSGGDGCTSTSLTATGAGQSCSFTVVFTDPANCAPGTQYFTTLDIEGKTSGFDYIQVQQVQAVCV